MSINKFSFETARQIPIVDYMSRLGFQPAKVRGADHWYHSPFREERAPSFKVNARLNLWFDHGTGSGGSIIDLGMKLFSCSPHEFLQRLYSDDKDMAGSLSSAIITSLAGKPAASYPAPAKLIVLHVDPLSDKDLIEYLRARSIPLEIAQRYCKQIHFRMNDRNYSAIGFPNQSGAWELRNHWFKGSSSPKDISIITFADAQLLENKNQNAISTNSKICVLEGFMDFLSAVQIRDEAFQKFMHQSDFLILNSLRLLSRNIALLQTHHTINLFLDNDKPAQDVKAQLVVNGIRFEDASKLYHPHKDVNEFLVATHKASKQSKDQSILEEPHPRPRIHKRSIRM